MSKPCFWSDDQKTILTFPLDLESRNMRGLARKQPTEYQADLEPLRTVEEKCKGGGSIILAITVSNVLD